MKKQHFVRGWVNPSLKVWAAGIMMLSLMACGETKYETGSYQVVPLPNEISETDGVPPFVIRSSTKICYPEGNAKMERTAHFLAQYIR